MKPTTFVDQLFFATVHLRAMCPDGRIKSATGFVYSEVVEGDRSFPALITNRHVVADAERLAVTVIQRDSEDSPVLGKTTEITLQVDGGLPSYFVGHPNDDVDVVAMPFQPIVQEMLRINAPPFYKSVGRDLMPTPEELDALDAIEQVMFVGYPAGLFDRVNRTPIVRQGVAASHLQLDYAGLPAFLVDAAVFPGSSGSPVFLSPNAVSTTRSNSITVGRRKPLLLGVLAAFHTTTVAGAVIEMPSAGVALIDQPLNLGIVFKAAAIDEVISALLAKRGLSRQAA